MEEAAHYLSEDELQFLETISWDTDSDDDDFDVDNAKIATFTNYDPDLYSDNSDNKDNEDKSQENQEGDSDQN